MTINLLTHGDLDGAGCAVLIKKALLFDAELNIDFCNYDDIDEKVEKILKSDFKDDDYGLLLITDICPSKKICELLDKIQNVILVDHHKTRGWVKKYDWAIFENGVCGTSLVYHRMIDKLRRHRNLVDSDEKVEEFVQAVDAWDCWHIDSEHRKRGENLNALTFFMGFENFIKEFSMDLESDKSITFSAIIKYINENKDRYVKNIIKNQLHETPYRMDDYGQTYKILFCDNYISEVAHAALEDDDSQDLWYIAVVNPTKNMVSLRTKRPDKIDVSTLAEKLGGGGHSTAAGLRINFRKKLEKTVSEKFNLLDSD